MAIGAAVDNAAETSGDLNKEAWDKYNLLRSAVLVEHDTDGTHLSTSGVVLKALFDANTLLTADTDDTPAALSVAASRLIGRGSTGGIAALTSAQVNSILGLATRALDNLSGVAINTSLISDTDNTDDLGSSTYEWKDLYIDGTANIDSLVADTADINGGTIDGITSLTAGGNLDIGAYTFTCAGLIDDTLTSGRVVFATTGGLLTDDNDFTFATDTLTVTKIGAFQATGAINFGSQNMTNVDIDSGTINGITALVAAGNLDIGAYDLRAQTLTADGLTSGRVVFAGASGILSDDGDMTFSTDTLTVKKLVLNDATTATTDMLTLTPTGAVAAAATWKGIYINGAALDPAGTNAAIEGVYVDLSGVASATGLEMRGVYTSVPAGLGYEAVHSIGKIKLDNDESSLAAGETATGVDIIVLASAAGGGEYHAIDVATTGTSSASLTALGTHTGIDVIHQHTGTFISPTKAWKFDNSGSSYTEVTTAFGSAGTDVTMFEDDDDAIFVGADAAFDEIEVILATTASVDIKPTFWYSKAASFTRFFPADDTEGFSQDGTIRFNADDLTDFAAQSVNGTSKFYIKIVRTKNNIVTDPIEDTIKTLAAVECFWNSVGATQVASIAVPTITTVTTFTASGNLDIGSYTLTAGGLIDDTLTSGRVVFVTTGGQLADDSDFLFATDTLTVTKLGAFQATGAIDFNTQAMTNVDINSGTINGITDLAVADGGTGSSSAVNARTALGLAIGTNVLAQQTIGIADNNLMEVDDTDAASTDYARFTATGLQGRDATEAKTDLGLVIGTNVQAWDTQLDDIAALAHTDGNFIVGDGSNWVAESGTTALASLGLVAELDNLTSGEVGQLEAIGTTTISATQWGYVGALTTHPIGGDGTAGLMLRQVEIVIENGTDPETLKCTVAAKFNGDTIAETNNIAKGATTGDFSLDVNGRILKIEASGLSGNVLFGFGPIFRNYTTVDLTAFIRAVDNDILVTTYISGTGAVQDLTDIVDVGRMNFIVLYMTDA